jgi:hypothetical protein
VPSPLVVMDSVGPYDYAVLKADDKTAMLDWLNTNHYFVPTGTDSVVMNYIHPGAYFLALKLKPGKSTGDIQPVVVHYNSDLPMIPITLTSVSAIPNMGIEVFVLGSARAIPRNYAHVVLNEAAIDWTNVATSYESVLTRAVAAGPGKHAFVTEFSDHGQAVGTALAPPGRFGDHAHLASLTDTIAFIQYVRDQNFGPYPFTGVVRAVLQAHITKPADLPFTDDLFYAIPDSYLKDWESNHPGQMLPAFDPVATADDLWKRVATPTLTAAQLFIDNAFLTRLVTTLSPEDMNLDPVFSFNPSLPTVSNIHKITMNSDCNNNETAVLEDGTTVPYPGSAAPAYLASIPAALRVEDLRESGAPQVTLDNSAATHDVIHANDRFSCALHAGPSGRGSFLLLMAICAGLLALRARRRTS